jgi:hypothetical protein
VCTRTRAVAFVVGTGVTVVGTNRTHRQIAATSELVAGIDTLATTDARITAVESASPAGTDVVAVAEDAVVARGRVRRM